MTSHRILAATTSVVLAATLATACSAAEDDGVRTTPASPSESPDAACTRQVSYWVGETLALAPDQGFDYQHMGLSGRTYEVVRSVTARARAVGRSDATWVAQQARSACREALEQQPRATSTSGGWP